MVRFRSLRPRSAASWFHLGAILLGAILRARHYFFNRSLWLDEAYLATNLIERTLPQLAAPLDFNQVAPFGFLAATKAVTVLLGESERSLRLLPFVSSLAALVLMSYFARRNLSPIGSLSAVIILAVSPAAITYAAEFKQYSSDLAIAALLLLVGLEMVEKSRPQPATPVLMALGIVAVWLSFPAVFILAAISITDLTQTIAGREWRRLRTQLLIYGSWLVSILSMLPLVHRTRSALAQEYFTLWQPGFLPFPPGSLSDLDRLLDRYLQLFDNVQGSPLWSGVALLAIVGGFNYLRHRARQAALLAAIVAAALVASFLELYPLMDRAALYLLPLLALLLAAGIEGMANGLGSLQWPVVIVLLAFILARPLRTSLLAAASPPAREMRAAYLWFQEKVRPSDGVYVYYGAEPLVRYYSQQYEAGPISFDYGTRSREEPKVYLEQLADHLGSDRVWMIFSHDHTGPLGLERELILSTARCYGDELQSLEREGAFIYLFDLSDEEVVDEGRWADCQPG